MDARKLGMLLLGLALLINLGAATSASHVDPPANDYLLHGQLVEGARATLTTDGWTQFQDPWFDELNGGYPVFHSYPHLPHQWTAAVAAMFKVDGFAAMAGANLLLVLLLPLLAFVGARWLGLERDAAGFAALVVATARCLDGVGHTPLEYGFSGHGLFGQLWGMAFAALAFPAWIAAVDPAGAGLGRLKPWARIALAAVLVSFVVRSNLPAGYLVIICAFVGTLALGPPSELPARLVRFGAVGAIAVVLSLGFLLPFAADLGATNASVLELVGEKRDSVGMFRVLGRLGTGFYLGLIWSLLLIAALGAGFATWTKRTAVERGLLVGVVASILLLFGRATWGQWMGSIPLLGRFHDHRYLLGLHLLAPWVIGAGLSAAIGPLGALAKEQLGDRWDDRLPFAVLLGIAALAALSFLPASNADRRQLAGTEASFEGAQTELDQLLTAARAVDGPVAWGPKDAMIGGTTRLSWLRRHGVLTVGRPLYHYSFVHDFALYWTESAAAGAPLEIADLQAAGVAKVFPDGPTAAVGPRLVRADLIATAVGSDFEGFAVAWFAEGVHARGQHPVMAVRGDVPAEPFQARLAIADRDPSALTGLKAAPELGTAAVVDGAPGEHRVQVDVLNRPAWLLLPVSWHPGWTVTIDGKRASSAMLAPGWLGVPMPRTGQQVVSASWRAAPWRGVWAGANIALCFILLLLPAVTRRDF